MSRVVVAWKPLSAKASAAASSRRSAVDASGSTSGRPGPAGRGGAAARLTACRRRAETKQALSYRWVPAQRTREHARWRTPCPATSTTRTTRRSARSVARVRRPRTLKPRAEEMLEVQVDRPRHLAGGRQAGLPRSRHPRGVRRRGRRRLPLQRRRSPRSSPASTSRVSSCFGIHSDVVPALHRRPRHRGAEAALAARHGHRRAHLRDRA